MDPKYPQNQRLQPSKKKEDSRATTECDDAYIEMGTDVKECANNVERTEDAASKDTNCVLQYSPYKHIIITITE